MPITSSTVLVAVAPSLLRQGLVATLQSSWPWLHLTLTADAAQIAFLTGQTGFGLLVLDANLPGSTLASQLAQVYQRRPTQRVLLLVDQRPGRGRKEAAPDKPLRLSRHVQPQALVAALSPWLAAPTHGVPCREAPAQPFSHRELQVLRLVVNDQCNEEIADHLCLSVRTVESHRRMLLHKAGTRTLVGLAARAVREGWVT